MVRSSTQVTLLAIVGLMASVSGCRCNSGPNTTARGVVGVVYTNAEGKQNSDINNPVYDFGRVPMGTSKVLKFAVVNLGAGQLDLATVEKESGAPVQIGATGDAAPVFKLAFEAATLSQNQAKEFDLTFAAPQEADAAVLTKDWEAKVILRSGNTDPGTPEQAAVTITFKGTAVAGTCNLPEVIDFGAVLLDEVSAQSVTLANPSPIDVTAYVGEITSGSGDNANFSITEDSPTGDILIASGRDKTINFNFKPTQGKDYLAFVDMRAAEQCSTISRVRLIGTGVGQIITLTPNPVDFGYVTPGLEVTAEATASNFSFKDVELTNLRIMSSEFRVAAAGSDLTRLTIPKATSMVMSDGSRQIVPGTAKLTLAFKPSLLGPRTAQLSATVPFEKQTGVTVQLKGYGGGPDIDVKPGALNVGRVAFFANSNSFITRKLTIQNVGTRPNPPDPRANLKLGVAGMGTSYWTWEAKNPATNKDELCVGTFANGTCTPAPATVGVGAYDPAVGLEASGAKALLDVPVRIAPGSVGSKEWEVTFNSNDPDEPAFKVTVKAEAVVFKACDATITPTVLNYGLLTPPAYKDLTFAIKNNLADPCLLSNLDLKAGSDVIFTLPAGPEQDLEIAGNATKVVRVRAWPQGALPATITNVTGAVTVNLANPDPALAERNVNLQATVGASCLTIAPNDRDFGTVAVTCNSETRSFSIYNTCPGSVTINSFSMVAPGGQVAGGPNCAGPGNCPEFIPISTAQIAPNTVLVSGAAASTFSIRYRPIDIGPDSGAFVIKATQNGQQVDYLVTLAGQGDTVGLNTDTFKQDSKPKADILLVIDDSCSMDAKQTSLGTNFDAFIKYANSAGVDYQIGVTTTDVCPLPPATFCSNPGPAGKLVAKSGNPKILTPLTPDVTNKFKAQVAVGINGSGSETFLKPALLALTAPLITSDNAGFLRNEAVLAVVAVSDARDQSLEPASFYVNQFLNIKGAQRPNLFSFNAISPTLMTAPAGCPGGYDDWNGSDPRVATVVSGTQGLREEICTPDWSKALENVGKIAFGYRTNFFLTAAPDPAKPITVQIDGMPLNPSDPRGTIWSFDPQANSVNFEPLFVPEPGKTLTVTYFALCN